MNEIQVQEVEQVIIYGDLSKLTPEQKLNYNKAVCESLGLNPLTKPFEYTRLNGKEVLYATKSAAEQLRKINKVSITDIKRENIGDLLMMTVKAQTPDGRTDTSTAALDLTGLSGEKLANALMKCETKAKRRVTLSICGLGMLDETEVESVKEVEHTVTALPEPEPKRQGPFYYNFSHIEDAQEKKALQTVAKEWGCEIDRDKKAWVCNQEVGALMPYEVEVTTDEN